MVKNEFVPPAECPVCGEPVPPRARACPGCGADERSGWDPEATRHDGLDLPPAAFDDERAPLPGAPPKRALVWMAVTVCVLLAVIITFVIR